MLTFVRTRLGKLVLGLMVVGVAAGGAIAATSLTAGASPPPVDHFLCYLSTSTATPVLGFKPVPVRLVNQFAPNGFVPRVDPVDFHCNPAQKIVGTHVTRITNPNAHLLCWHLTVTQPSRIVRVRNQFGTGVLQTSSPTQLCLPSWKSLTGPPKQPTVAPPGLSHFTCYPVAYVPGTAPFKPPAGVRVRDQFSPAPVTVTVGPPKLLCLPTTKITAKATYPMVNSALHLLCFQVSPTPTKNPVYDQNQFGTGKVNIQHTSLLCLPSTKQVLH
jgi:hypothetical protein